MSYYCESSRIEIPSRFPQSVQHWIPTLQNPYPMNFIQAPSVDHQIFVNYKNGAFLQGLHPVKGPIMFPLNSWNSQPKTAWEMKHTIPYPITHSIPGPYLQSYIYLPNKIYTY